MSEHTRICTACRESKPNAEFYRSNAAANANQGYYYYCKSCCKARYQERKIRNASASAKVYNRKSCPCCRENLARDAFYQSTTTADRLSPYCKECTKDKARERNEKMRARASIELPESKACSACKETKPAAAFSPTRQRTDGLSTYCKPCAAARSASFQRKRSAELAALRAQVALLQAGRV